MRIPFLYWDPGVLFYDEQVPLKGKAGPLSQVVRSLIVFKRKRAGVLSFPEPYLPAGKKPAFRKRAVQVRSMGYSGQLGGTGIGRETLSDRGNDVAQDQASIRRRRSPGDRYRTERDGQHR